jgi:hypothetical protein
MGFFEDIARAEREAEKVFGTPFKFEEDAAARVFRCVFDPVNRSALSVGEVNQDIDAEAHISSAQLDAAALVPVIGTVLLVEGRRYVVLSMTMPTGTAYLVTLKGLE